ncbi:Protein-tyrosine phosphatase [Oesophagostomum dentatum]|uniref:Protein-tyrosine phosphatase n=1 Tax=Oesophagostomum dentatum TaxID=61180 RepID=A0A0B1SNV7_OESDE|nr:Protein-tyrosine phosphatase [Oesophagostomum dentatum]
MSILRREFVKNKRYKPPTYTFEACKSNEAKNRYDDVICIDGSRVVLKGRPPDNNYIHANWVVMPDKCKYICTQGPLQETVTDFWHMIYSENSTVIVMLCAFEEGKNEKCAIYLPQTKRECGKFGPYRVYLRQEKESPFAGVKYNVLLVRKEKKCDDVYTRWTTFQNHYLEAPLKYIIYRSLTGLTTPLLSILHQSLE